MKLLVVNPNTNPATTERVAVMARRAASPETTIEAVTAPFGVPAIESPAQCVPEPVLAALAAHGDGMDAAVIAAFGDPGLAGARKRFPFPVVGIAEASMLEAARAGRFAILTLGAVMEDHLRGLARSYGVAESLAAIRFLPWSVSEASERPEALLGPLLDACLEAVREDTVAALIVGGGPLSGLAERLAPRVPVPVLDGVACAVGRAEALTKAV